MKELVAKAESSILAPFGMSMIEFRQNGLANFGAEIFSRLFYQIEQLSLEVTFMVYGFEAGQGHIFTIKDKGEVSHFDQPAFWAIGSGQNSALGSLFSISGTPINYKSVEDVVYLLCKAKFLSESAPGVGPSTNVNILKKDGSRKIIYTDAIEELKAHWKKHNAPIVPPGGDDLAKKIIRKARKFRRSRVRSVASGASQT
jgi:20S proteasome alpha/beta subunit